MTSLRPKTVKLLARFIRPLVDEGIVFMDEEKTILKNLRHLSEKSSLAPTITPRLIKREEASNLLSVSIANFKRIEAAGGFSFRKKIVGNGAVRYRLIDILDWINDSAENVPQ